MTTCRSDVLVSPLEMTTWSPGTILSPGNIQREASCLVTEKNKQSVILHCGQPKRKTYIIEHVSSLIQYPEIKKVMKQSIVKGQ